ncbi:hypothetical protein [Sutcliffiella rhizosphaerae]|uniref:Uncharacterized protein n=1 Tax=Sutcliffiella rhizosphaerae TaxID=2880967 RepID=A0ABM8YLB9_9BACI|nr:hypothetical protein [Sutcliffiella rhizosphaerae]CAG9620757.1 hypothetical protein BACCIP111883_01527 [Sutcliffiella rhizosphaerae]
MFEIVKNSKQQKAFQQTWEHICEKQDWYNDPYARNGVRYNLLHIERKVIFSKKKVIGTIEFLPYDPLNPQSTVEGPSKYEFSKLEKVKLHQDRTWEIDKLCLNEAYQRKGNFPLFIHIFYDHIQKHNPKYYIGLMEKKFFRMVRIIFGIGLEQPGDELCGSTTSLIPVIFHIEKLMEDKEKVEHFLRMVK